MSQVGHRTIEEAETEAAANGLVCIVAQEDELLLDLDGGEKQLNSQVLLALMDNHIVADDDPLWTVSKSSHNHYYIRLTQPMGDTKRIALQAALGSDPMKEAMTVLRVNQGSEAPIVLFEKPVHAERVNQWRKQK